MVKPYSPVRMKKVLEGRMVWNSLDGNQNERLHDLFKYRYASDDGFSKKEVALIVWPELSYRSKKGGERPLPIAVDYADNIISKFRKWLENQSLVLVTERLTTGEWIIYNVQKRRPVDKYEQQAKGVIRGLSENIENQNRIFGLGKKKRIANAEVLSQEIRLRARRKRKQSGGDFEQ